MPKKSLLALCFLMASLTTAPLMANDGWKVKTGQYRLCVESEAKCRQTKETSAIDVITLKADFSGNSLAGINVNEFKWIPDESGSTVRLNDPVVQEDGEYSFEYFELKDDALFLVNDPDMIYILVEPDGQAISQKQMAEMPNGVYLQCADNKAESCQKTVDDFTDSGDYQTAHMNLYLSSKSFFTPAGQPKEITWSYDSAKHLVSISFFDGKQSVQKEFKVDGDNLIDQGSGEIFRRALSEWDMGVAN